MYIIFGYLFFIAYHYNFDMNYYNCVQPAMGKELCLNPFYEPATWKNAEYLPPGEYGFKPGLMFNSLKAVVFGFFILMFALNHFWHNKGSNLLSDLKRWEL